MVSSSYSTSERGRVNLVMVISSCSTSGRGRVTLSGNTFHSKNTTTSVTSRTGTVAITRVTRPLSLVVLELLSITRITRSRITLVMVSNSYSASDRGRVTLVMVSSNSCSTSGKGHLYH
jgi:hypothetical protein